MDYTRIALKPVLSAKQMQACDQNTIINHKIPSLVLMERAALSVANIIREKFNTDTVIGVICGSGNNGGDGVAIARLLHMWGYTVKTGIIGSPTKYSEQLIQEIEMANSYDMYITCILDKNIETALSIFDDCDVIVDAIFGIGLTREVSGLHKSVIDYLNNLRTPKSKDDCDLKYPTDSSTCDLHIINKVSAITHASSLHNSAFSTNHPYTIAVDIPSGISSDTGNILGVAIEADETITFAYNKLGLLISDGYLNAGKVTVADVGIYLDVTNHSNIINRGVEKTTSANINTSDAKICDTYIIEESDLSYIPKRPVNANKGTCGKVLIIAGSRDIYGACYLSAKAALVTGSGLVKIYTHENNRASIQQMLPEAMCTTYNDIIDNTDELFSLLKWADSIIIGPGLGTNSQSEQLLKFTLQNASCPIVVDADGLNILSKHLDWIEKYNEHIAEKCHAQEISLHNCTDDLYKDGNKNGSFISLHNSVPQLILTPHIKEMSRLTQKETAEILKELKTTAVEFASKYNCIIDLKNFTSVISIGGTNNYINTTGNESMATPGSGDVLAGIIGSLIGQGINPAMATPLGAYIHGKAGEVASTQNGIKAVLATDIINKILF